MRNPRIWRNVALIALPACVLLFHAASLQQQAAPGLLLGIPGFVCLTYVLMFGWPAHRAARAQSRLADGKDVIARWRVDAATWHAFAERERTLRSGDALLNELHVRDDLPADGIEVVVGEDAILIGGSVHVLPRHGAPEVIDAQLHQLDQPLHLAELRLRHPPSVRANGGATPARFTRLAFPLPASAWRDARTAIGFYARGRPGKASFFHGRGDGSDPEDLSTCGRCGHRTHVYRATCPQCGGGMLSKRWARRYGVVLVVLGAALTVGMTILLYHLGPLLEQPGVDVGGSRFTGSSGQALGVWAILAAVWAFGATSVGMGTWQLATGKRNLRAAGVMLLLLGTVAMVARVL